MKYKNVLREETDAVIMGLFAFYAVMHVLSWTVAPVLSATGRLSTSPVVILLCCIGIRAVRVKDWRATRIISGLTIPVMIAGRFTFSILGGAPPLNGWNIYEFRCICEVMILILIFVLCMIHGTEESWDGALIGRTLMPFLTDVYDNPIFSLSRTRKFQIALCVLAAALMVVSSFSSGVYALYTIFYVPFIILLSGDRNNKNFVGLIMLVKTAADLASNPFLQSQDMFALFVALDVLAVIMVFMGKRETYSMVLMVQISALVSGMMLFCCITVDRSSPYFYRYSAAWGSEIAVYLSLLLFGYGRGWSSNSLASLLRALMALDEHHPDDDWIEVQPAEQHRNVERQN